MSEIADALIHLHDRLAELGAEVKPSDSPKVVIRWTVEDYHATQVLVSAMWQGISMDHERLLRAFRDRRAATSIGQATDGSSTPSVEASAGGDAPTARKNGRPQASNSADPAWRGLD